MFRYHFNDWKLRTLKRNETDNYFHWVSKYFHVKVHQEQLFCYSELPEIPKTTTSRQYFEFEQIANGIDGYFDENSDTDDENFGGNEVGDLDLPSGSTFSVLAKHSFSSAVFFRTIHSPSICVAYDVFDVHQKAHLKSILVRS